VGEPLPPAASNRVEAVRLMAHDERFRSAIGLQRVEDGQRSGFSRAMGIPAGWQMRDWTRLRSRGPPAWVASFVALPVFRPGQERARCWWTGTQLLGREQGPYSWASLWNFCSEERTPPLHS